LALSTCNDQGKISRKQNDLKLRGAACGDAISPASSEAPPAAGRCKQEVSVIKYQLKILDKKIG
jgi:hypothetical protein